MNYVLNPYCLPVPWYVSNRITKQNEIITMEKEKIISSHLQEISSTLHRKQTRIAVVSVDYRNFLNPLFRLCRG